MKVIDITGNTKRIYNMNNDHSVTLLESTEELDYCPIKGSLLEVW